MRILVIIADIDEYTPFTKGLSDYNPVKTDLFSLPAVRLSVEGKEVFAVCSGLGKVNAAVACALALSNGKYDGVLNMGYSGAVYGLRKNDIVAGESYVECDFDLTAIGYALGEKSSGSEYIRHGGAELIEAARRIGIQEVALGSGDFFLTDKAKSAEYHRVFSINAFDMESGALANVCSLMKVPFLSVRKISDSADDCAEGDYRATLNTGETAFSELLVKILGEL